MRYTPRPYQQQATEFVIEHPRCGLFLDMSLGKTVCTLTAIESLIYDDLEIEKVLVIAPPRVARDTWPAEVEKWEHLSHLRVSLVAGTAPQRLAALERPADVYLISRDLVVWLTENARFDFDMVVIDELSSFKSSTSKRFRALKKYIRRAKRVVGLTGTPASNNYMDLWSEMYLIDTGAALGKTLGEYRRAYFRPGRSSGYVVYEYILLAGSKELIFKRLEDKCISMKKEDYVSLPEKIFTNVPVTLDKKSQAQYDEMLKEAVLSFDDDLDIAAVNAAAVGNKLQQIANGAIYDEEREVHYIHELKLDALEDLYEASNGQPVLVFYSFQHDRDQIMAMFPEARVIDDAKSVKDWNAGKIPMAIAHPASVGHGLNLQFGGHTIIWYGLTWSLELYLQANDRLHRPGQEHPVLIYHIVAKGTVDEAILNALEAKNSGQKALIDYLKAEKRGAKTDER